MSNKALPSRMNGAIVWEQGRPVVCMLAQLFVLFKDDIEGVPEYLSEHSGMCHLILSSMYEPDMDKVNPLRSGEKREGDTHKAVLIRRWADELAAAGFRHIDANKLWNFLKDKVLKHIENQMQQSETELRNYVQDTYSNGDSA